MITLLALAIYGFSFVKQSFFPNSTAPMFYVNYWLSEGTDIRKTAKDMQVIEKEIQNIKHVNSVTSLVGEGALRFMLVYAPEKPNSSYGQFLVRTDNYRNIPRVIAQVKSYLQNQYPTAEPTFKRIKLGPGTGEDIEVRFSGPDAKILRELSYKAQKIMHQSLNAVDVRSDWRQPIKMIEPQYSKMQAQNTGIFGITWLSKSVRHAN